MKKLFFAAVIALISFSASAQKNDNIVADSIPVIDGTYQFEEVVNVNSALTKDQLYKNAKQYFMDVFVGAKDAFQYDDKGEGRIIGKGIISVDDYKTTFPGVASLKWDVNYNVEITCKDGKYRYRVYDMVITKECHLAENNFRNVYLPIKDAYAAIPNQRGPYKTLYPKVINKLVTSLKTNIQVLKENMVKKQPDFSASF